MQKKKKMQKKKRSERKKTPKKKGKWQMTKKIMTYWINIESRARQALLPG